MVPHISIIASYTIKKTQVNYGFTLPDPSSPDRHSIQSTAGTIEPASKEYLEDQKRLFCQPKSLGKKRADSLASEILHGGVSELMDENGRLGYYLTQPINRNAYCEVIYMDANIRVIKSHSGSF